MKYYGYRAQDYPTIGITNGIFASEGEGVYVSLGWDLANQFMSKGRYFLELEFEVNNPIRVGHEPLYGLNENPEVEEPLDPGDSHWLRANKLAYQDSMREANQQWGKAGERYGYWLTANLKRVGYDGVFVDLGDERWMVVFDPSRVKIIKKTQASTFIHSGHQVPRTDRLTRLAQAFFRRALRLNKPHPLGLEENFLLKLLDKNHDGLTLDQINKTAGKDFTSYLKKLLNWGYLERTPDKKFRTMGVFHF